VWRPKHVEWT